MQSINERSPAYGAAIKAIGLYADPKTTYKQFGDDRSNLQDTEQVYRSAYHKIANEVMVLKSIAQRLARRLSAEHPIVNEIIRQLEDLQDSIKHQRTSEKASLAKLPYNDHDAIMAVIAETAHHIADHVGQTLAVTISKARRAQHKLDLEPPQAKSLEKLLAQLLIAQNALNDLKNIKAGTKVKTHRFPVVNLFEKWKNIRKKGHAEFENARIYLEIKNPTSEIDSDEEKIKSAINELVENAIKHNSDRDYFKIRIQSRDTENPYELGSIRIPGDRRYLQITVSDTGKGVPKDKKDWIFQPAHTTAADDGGSGLGLYIIRKTLQQLGGHILEDGTPGKSARFKIFLPYNVAKNSNQRLAVRQRANN